MQIIVYYDIKDVTLLHCTAQISFHALKTFHKMQRWIYLLGDFSYWVAR